MASQRRGLHAEDCRGGLRLWASIPPAVNLLAKTLPLVGSVSAPRLDARRAPDLVRVAVSAERRYALGFPRHSVRLRTLSLSFPRAPRMFILPSEIAYVSFTTATTLCRGERGYCSLAESPQGEANRWPFVAATIAFVRPTRKPRLCAAAVEAQRRVAFEPATHESRVREWRYRSPVWHHVRSRRPGMLGQHGMLAARAQFGDVSLADCDASTCRPR